MYEIRPERKVIISLDIIMSSFTFFMAHIKHKYIREIIKSLEKYIDDDTSYLISMETSATGLVETNGEHLHFAVSNFENKYDSFRKTVFVNEYKLRGQAKHGLPRQYGKIKKDAIRSETNFLTYMCKDYYKDNKNLFCKNLLKEDLVKYIEESYQKMEKVDLETQIMQYIDENLKDDGDPDRLELYVMSRIIEFYILKLDKIVSRNKVEYFLRCYIQRCNRYNLEQKTSILMRILRIY